MTFLSFTFIAFFAVVLIVLSLLNVGFIRNKVKNVNGLRHILLLVASYIFYGWWDWRFCGLLLLLTIVAYVTALNIQKNRENKIWIIIGVVLPLVILAFFKYFNFFAESVTAILGKDDWNLINIILPLGISFYTFQSMSYIIDVYRGKIRACDSFIKIALYISFFPQISSGPIVKASFFLPQLDEDRRTSINGFFQGAQIFIFGLIKKIVIADHLSIFVNEVFNKPDAFSGSTILLAIVSYSIQLYCDFSGYSDMAVGCAKCMGYDLPRNFNVPYLSKNVTEFWKRWHISLSTWLQEYLYISLGGNRKGKIRTYVNLILTMTLGGLWHGASWNFIIWGLLHGIALCVHKIYSKLRKNKIDNVVTSVLSVISTYLFVCVCWVFFRVESFGDAIKILGRVVRWENGIHQAFLWSIIAIIIVGIASVMAYLNGRKMPRENMKIGITEGYYPVMDLSKLISLIILFIVLGITLGIAYTESNPFIYSQF